MVKIVNIYELENENLYGIKEYRTEMAEDGI